VDPDADRLWGWDDTAGVFTGFTMGTTLSVTGTTIDVIIGGAGGAQAYDPDLTTWAGVTSTAIGRTIVTAANVAAVQAALSLVPGSNVQIQNGNLNTWSNVAPFAFMQTFIGSADVITARSNLGVGIGSAVQAYSTNLDLVTTPGNWKVFYTNGTGVLTALTLGADGTYLKSNGAAVAPTWVAPGLDLAMYLVLLGQRTQPLPYSTQPLGSC